MPKIRTHRGAAKRFRKTKKGKLVRAKAYRGHLFLCKSSRQKRSLRKNTLVSAADRKRMKSLLPGL